jgi:general secretion pathway protein A
VRRRLGMAVYEALSQRIVVRYHFGGLTRDELAANHGMAGVVWRP